MSQVKLKTNVIIGKKFLSRGSIVDSDILPEHLRTDEWVSHDLDVKEGKVLLLWSLQYSSLLGDGVSYPGFLEKGQLVRLSDLPESCRRDLVEGVHFKTNWSEADRSKILAQAEKEHQMAFSPEIDIPPRR